MSWEICLLEPVESWFLKLCETDAHSAALIVEAIDLLAQRGPTLGRPLVDTLQGSRLPNLKELRPASRRRTEIRILFVFDPDRQAIFLVAGDKAGQWSRWYEEAIPLAEARYQEYREEQKEQRS
ncbi:type II toxin-antitoxin system RelE/ParE family toxin [Embleya hyalina]|uniref:type II toxin-antitoxin system RelE/ParE family toxin n=1 Tax=Embleya hyalina TaxID=516124 RepID=UPI000F839161|nr:type II toxin-antitoxin system RelE/ParE family toxin [Embleya hyalina]